MTQEERLAYMIRYLLNERGNFEGVELPDDLGEKRILLRSLMNTRQPAAVDPDFLKVQDAYLEKRLAERGVVRMEDLSPIQPGLYLWQGDITLLAADAIVNAANRQMLGCFVPCHRCIDNAVHTYAGVQLRLECASVMDKKKKAEPVGQAVLTSAYNLPCCHVLHTVGPFISGPVSKTDRKQLESCYRSCLDLAAVNGLESIAFCCISTGEFHFPNQQAAEIAVRTVKEWQRNNPDKVEVIFNVFKDIDYEIYKSLLR